MVTSRKEHISSDRVSMGEKCRKVWALSEPTTFVYRNCTMAVVVVIVVGRERERQKRGKRFLRNWSSQEQGLGIRHLSRWKSNLARTSQGRRKGEAWTGCGVLFSKVKLIMAWSDRGHVCVWPHGGQMSGPKSIPLTNLVLLLVRLSRERKSAYYYSLTGQGTKT